MPLTNAEKMRTLMRCVELVRPTVDSDLSIITRVIAPDAIEILVKDDGGDDPQPVLDLAYVGNEDHPVYGPLLKATRLLADGVTKQDAYFYGHGHILGCLLLN